jgi:hypothetical protein
MEAPERLADELASFYGRSRRANPANRQTNSPTCRATRGEFKASRPLLRGRWRIAQEAVGYEVLTQSPASGNGQPPALRSVPSLRSTQSGSSW